MITTLINYFVKTPNIFVEYKGHVGSTMLVLCDACIPTYKRHQILLQIKLCVFFFNNAFLNCYLK